MEIKLTDKVTLTVNQKMEDMMSGGVYQFILDGEYTWYVGTAQVFMYRLFQHIKSIGKEDEYILISLLESIGGEHNLTFEICNASYPYESDDDAERDAERKTVERKKIKSLNSITQYPLKYIDASSDSMAEFMSAVKAKGNSAYVDVVISNNSKRYMGYRKFVEKILKKLYKNK